MIEKMTKYSFVLLSGDKEIFMDSLRSLGVVDITRGEKPVDGNSEKMLSSILDLKRTIREIEKCSDSRLKDLQAELSAREAVLRAVKVWGNYDQARLSSLGLPLHFCSVKTGKFDPSWSELYPLQVVGDQDGLTYFVVLSEHDLPVREQSVPSLNLSQASDAVDQARRDLENHAEILRGRSSELPELREQLSREQKDLSAYLASLKAVPAAEDSLVTFVGFAPAENSEAIAVQLDTLPCIYILEDARAEDNPPIKFRNNRFVKMFEVLTDMYGRPSYDGFDPTPYISIFFLLFFAMCMGDAGYGVLLIIIGLLLGKGEKFASLSPLVVVLGAATFVVGFFFHNFFSMDISTWKCIPDSVKSLFVPSTIAGFDGTMILALAVGVVHLSLAMIVKTVYAARNKGFLNSLSIWGWTIFLVGCVVVGAFALAGVIGKDATKIAIISLGALSALGIFFFNDLHRNPLKNIGVGLWETYNTATGILGDVLSYLRLYALGLAGGMLGYAFNDLALMARGDGGIGWVFFVFILVVGHALNVAMAALGAFVHPLRLNFLEFFKNSDYQGAGLKYNPLSK